ncbi:MAG: beta-lactamase family protein [Oscillospiraceae bacterium]|nr:beta-lactamase family protein [Oscillospiraceae bacterium]
MLRNGWLVYERYFGKASREATPNLASCGKSFTSIAMGILMSERSEYFPSGIGPKNLHACISAQRSIFVFRCCESGYKTGADAVFHFRYQGK